MGGDHHATTSPNAEQRRSVKWCELCKLPANLYCPSDEANLCWQCDAQIHSANFLVARHCRTLVCCWCGDPISTHTPHSGPRIEPRLQFCRHCVHIGGGRSKDGKLSSSESCCIAGPDEASCCESSIVQHRPRQRSLKRKRSILAAAADAGERSLPGRSVKEGFGDSEHVGAHHASKLPSFVKSAHKKRHPPVLKLHRKLV